jgi:lysyl-tRNA synthetase class 1
MEQHNKSELRDKHWSELLADRVISEKKPPYIVTGGMTTSGPAHLGTVCEFLYPAMLGDVLKGKGHGVKVFFVADILDAFDGIPVEMQEYAKELEPELGKPLSDVRDPLGCHQSFGEHYLSQALEIMKLMRLELTVVRAPELYTSGAFDGYTRLFLTEEKKTKEVVARTSFRKVEDFKDWSPIMPVCEKCGKIATTRVTWHSEDEYEYVCDRDVKYTKGCGYRGRARISDHRYKLQWRLHWPCWQAHFESSIEGSGVDHMTRGGSADTAIAVHRELFNREPLILFKYGFVLFEGKKFSKSKGIGMGALELLRFLPPELLKYLLVVPNVQQNKDINPTGDSMLRLYEDAERISRLEKPEDRADEKKMQAFGFAVKRLAWRAPFVDMLLNYQIYRDWGKVGELLGDREGVAYLAPYITEWLSRGMAPEQYNFALKQGRVDADEQKIAIAVLIGKLKDGMDAVQVHNLIYEAAEESGVGAEVLFAAVYKAMIGKEKGPRLGKLIVAVGVSKTKDMLATATA